MAELEALLVEAQVQQEELEGKIRCLLANRSSPHEGRIKKKAKSQIRPARSKALL